MARRAALSLRWTKGRGRRVSAVPAPVHRPLPRDKPSRLGKPEVPKPLATAIRGKQCRRASRLQRDTSRCDDCRGRGNAALDASPAAQRAGRPRSGGVVRGDASSSRGRGLVQDDLEGGRDRHADDRPDDAEQRPADQDAAMTVKPETFTAFPMIVGCRM
jgi:hypothetical protein